MHNLQGHIVGFQFLIENLNSEKESAFLKVNGNEFHIIGPKYFDQSMYTVSDCNGFRTHHHLIRKMTFVSDMIRTHSQVCILYLSAATEFVCCYFARTELILLLMLDYEPFPLLVAECCNHEQKINHLTLKETQKKKYYHHRSFLRLFHESNLFYY